MIVLGVDLDMFVFGLVVVVWCCFGLCLGVFMLLFVGCI